MKSKEIIKNGLFLFILISIIGRNDFVTAGNLYNTDKNQTQSNDTSYDTHMISKLENAIRSNVSNEEISSIEKGESFQKNKLKTKKADEIVDFQRLPNFTSYLTISRKPLSYNEKKTIPVIGPSNKPNDKSSFEKHNKTQKLDQKDVKSRKNEIPPPSNETRPILKLEFPSEDIEPLQMRFAKTPYLHEKFMEERVTLLKKFIKEKKIIRKLKKIDNLKGSDIRKLKELSNYVLRTRLYSYINVIVIENLKKTLKNILNGNSDSNVELVIDPNQNISSYLLKLINKIERLGDSVRNFKNYFASQSETLCCDEELLEMIDTISTQKLRQIQLLENLARQERYFFGYLNSEEFNNLLRREERFDVEKKRIRIKKIYELLDVQTFKIKRKRRKRASRNIIVLHLKKILKTLVNTRKYFMSY